MKTPTISIAIFTFITISFIPISVDAQQNVPGNRVFGSATDEKKRNETQYQAQKSSEGQPKQNTPSSPRMKGDMFTFRNPRPGGLKEFITPDIKKRVRRLAVEGAINKDDASILRSISNRTSCVDDRGKTIDNYLDLDLSRATIESSYTSKRDVTYDDMFNYSNHLRSIRLPLRLKGIGSHSFYNCTRLERIIIPQGVRYLGDGAFKGCTKLEDIMLPETLEEIGAECFQGCKRLSSIILPSSLSVIGKEAFRDCPIKSIQLPDGLQSLGKWSLAGTALRSIYIPRDTHIEGDAPGSNINLEEIIVDRENREYSSIDGILFNHSQTMLFQVPVKIQGEYSIPNSVTAIGAYAFQNSQLSKIHIPTTVTSIDQGAFYGCKNVNSFEIPSSVSTISNQLFSDCRSLQSVILPENLQSIGSLVFSNCVMLNNIKMPYHLRTLGKEVFRSCHSLLQIRIPESITEIPTQCFVDCRNLAAITLPSRLRSIGDGAFKECTSIQEITIPASVVAIGKKPFNKCDQLQRVICEGTTPPTLKSKGSEKITLVVPAGCRDIYKKASQWKKFKSIVEK